MAGSDVGSTYRRLLLDPNAQPPSFSLGANGGRLVPLWGGAIVNEAVKQKSDFFNKTWFGPEPVLSTEPSSYVFNSSGALTFSGSGFFSLLPTINSFVNVTSGALIFGGSGFQLSSLAYNRTVHNSSGALIFGGAGTSIFSAAAGFVSLVHNSSGALIFGGAGTSISSVFVEPSTEPVPAFQVANGGGDGYTPVWVKPRKRAKPPTTVTSLPIDVVVEQLLPDARIEPIVTAPKKEVVFRARAGFLFGFTTENFTAMAGSGSYLGLSNQGTKFEFRGTNISPIYPMGTSSIFMIEFARIRREDELLELI